ncbi:MAG: hypothetical protein AB1810_09110 [Pseudomonadota bacterium]
MLDSIETTPEGTTRNWVTEDAESVEMEPHFLPFFSKNPGIGATMAADIDNPISSGTQIDILGGLRWDTANLTDKILSRTSDMSALLANEEYCGHRASKQFIDNLFKALR